MASKKVQKAIKEVQVLARYSHKTDGKPNGIVSYLVRASDGKSNYCTTLIDGKASGCSCKARGNCYHKQQLEAKEQERQVLAQQFAAQRVPTWLVQLAQAGTLVAPTLVVKMPAQEVVSPKAQERATYWDDNRACLCYRDTRKPTGSLEGVDHGLSKVTWNAEEECFEVEEAPEETKRDYMKATLNGNRGFSLLKVS